MSSSDFTFISLRNITAYQPTGSWVPQNYLLNMSTNGAAEWTNRITLETVTGSTVSGNTIIGSTISVLNRLSVTSSFFTTPTNYTNTGTSATSSMLIVIGQSLWKIPVEFVSVLE